MKNNKFNFEGLNKKQLLEKRYELLDRAGEILTTAKAQNRELTEKEDSELQECHRGIHFLDIEMEQEELRSSRAKDQVLGYRKKDEEYLTSAENNVPVFTIYERTEPTGAIADWYARNHDVPEAVRKVSPGQLIRAKLSGPKTDIEKRAVETTPDSQGGFAVPEYLAAKVMDNVRAKSHVLSSGAQTIILDSKNYKIAKLVGDPTSAWVAESGNITGSDPVFDAVAFQAKKLVSRVDASGEWLQDAVNADRAIEMALYGTIGQEVDRSALLGEGSSTEPKGIFSYTNANVYEMGVNGAAITNYDPYLEAIKLMYDDNAETPNTAIMAPRTWLAQAKFKDTTNQPLQLPPALSGMQFKQTSKIPVDQEQGTADNASCVFLGGFENLYMGLRLSLQIITVPLLVATKYQWSFLAVTRLDWQPFREQAFGIIKGIKPA